MKGCSQIKVEKIRFVKHMFPVYCYLSRFKAHLNLNLVFWKVVVTCIFAITFLKALAFYRFISANQLNSLTWESTSELCSHFNL